MREGYKKIFWGMFFATFNINLGNIDILPNFVGLLIICSGLKELLKDYKYESFEKASQYISMQALISFITFLLTFIGLASLLENTVFSIIWFNIGNILEILGIVKILEGSSELLAERLVCNDESIEYKNKAGKYIIIYSIVIVLANINFIFMSNMISAIIAVAAVVTKIWIIISINKLSKY